MSGGQGSVSAVEKYANSVHCLTSKSTILNKSNYMHMRYYASKRIIAL